ncbi:hypothetical protein OAC89_02580 [Deltaproteobacteria bacterium]|nr:hypothetical protein [Deltaproteobacteria bacterium]
MDVFLFSKTVSINLVWSVPSPNRRLPEVQTEKASRKTAGLLSLKPFAR